MSSLPGQFPREGIDASQRQPGSPGRLPVILLPGGILPAGPAYEALLGELGDDFDARAKDLEIYAGDVVPPAGYSLETEVDGIRRVADGAGFETFHLVGYSAGGASSLAFASRHPKRLRSLALMEPAWAGRTGQTPEEAAVFERFRAIPELSPDGIMPAFVQTQLAAGVEPPPPPVGPPPPWLPSRLAGIGAFVAAFDAFEPDFDALQRFDRPVYFALGGRGNPDLYARMAERLSRASSPTSRSKSSLSATTSIPRTGSNRPGWRPRFGPSGRGRSRSASSRLGTMARVQFGHAHSPNATAKQLAQLSGGL